jgi:RNA polymerase sigma-70 factor (ECF subfamily)
MDRPASSNEAPSGMQRGATQPPTGPIDWQAALAEHDRWLRTIVLARVGERQAVDEVMQEVSLAAVRQQAPIADREKIAPWLYRLAVRQALMYRRRMGRARKLTERFGERFQPTEADSRSHDPLDWLLAEERRRMVRDALDRLPPRDAEILLLKYTEDWSYHEIAQHLGIGHSAVEARLHRARRRLREQLATADIAEAAAHRPRNNDETS